MSQASLMSMITHDDTAPFAVAEVAPTGITPRARRLEVRIEIICSAVIAAVVAIDRDGPRGSGAGGRRLCDQKSDEHHGDQRKPAPERDGDCKNKIAHARL